MYLSLGSRLEEPHLHYGDQESSKGYPKKDEDLIVDLVDKQVVIETSGLSAHGALENFFESAFSTSCTGCERVYEREISGTVYYRLVATNQRGEIADEEWISCQRGCVESRTGDSALLNYSSGCIVIDKGIGYVTEDIHADRECHTVKDSTNRAQQHEKPVQARRIGELRERDRDKFNHVQCIVTNICSSSITPN